MATFYYLISLKEVQVTEHNKFTCEDVVRNRTQLTIELCEELNRNTNEIGTLGRWAETQAKDLGLDEWFAYETSWSRDELLWFLQLNEEWCPGIKRVTCDNGDEHDASYWLGGFNPSGQNSIVV
jgi:hypothetical protein